MPRIKDRSLCEAALLVRASSIHSLLHALTGKANLAGMWREKVDQHNTGNPIFERIERVIVERAPQSVPNGHDDGGRRSGKSHFFGELTVEKCLVNPGMLAVCIREVQKSLLQSSKRLIESKIQSLASPRYPGLSCGEQRRCGGRRAAVLGRLFVSVHNLD